MRTGLRQIINNDNVATRNLSLLYGNDTLVTFPDLGANDQLEVSILVLLAKSL